MNSLLTIRPWSVVTSTLSRLAQHARTSRAVAPGAKAGRLAFLILPSAFLLLSLSPARAAAPSTELPAVDHYVHLKFLPKASELVQDAKINNLTILRIDELADRVIVSYQYPDGHTATLGYMKLDSNGAATPAQPVAVTSSANVSTARYTVAARDPEVIYVSRPSTTVYYTDPYYYNSWAPWTVGFGIGWSSAYYGSYYRPYPYYGYYGGGHYHGGGHKHGGYHGGYRGGGSNHGGGYHSSGGYGRGSSVGYSGGRGGGGHSSGSHSGGGRGRR